MLPLESVHKIRNEGKANVLSRTQSFISQLNKMISIAAVVVVVFTSGPMINNNIFV